MRLSHAVALARMLLLFFSRRVLRLGILKSGAARLFVAAICISLMVVCVSAAYLFLKPLGSDPKVWRLLFDMSTVSLLLWVQVAFLFVKTLFLNAEGMLELSFQFPLTNRERAAAFMIYEGVMTSIVAVLGFLSLSISSLMILGAAAIPQLFQAIILPVVLAYLALSVLYLLLGRLIAVFRLRNMEKVVLIVAMFALLLAYASQMTRLTRGASEAYLNGQDNYMWVASLSWISRHYGPVVMQVIFLLISLALMVVAILLTPNQHVPHSRYLKVPMGRVVHRFLSPYDLGLLRSTQTALAATVSLSVLVFLIINPMANPLWSLSLLSMGGLYQFSATLPLRTMVPTRLAPWKTYGSLVKAQGVLLATFALPMLFFVEMMGRYSISSSLTAVLGGFCGAIIAVCVGIAFPAENDNPFSVFIGLSLTFCVLGMVGIGLGFLRLTPVATIGVVAVTVVIFVWYSVQGIRVSDSRRRHEEIIIVGKQHRRSGDADTSSHRLRTALFDVHD
jgi:hypothetical protein